MNDERTDGDDAPTPRLTKTWNVHEASARDLASRLRAAELAVGAVGPSLDTARGDVLRRTRMLVADYGGAFARWPKSGKSTEIKARDLREFDALKAFAAVLLEAPC